MDYAPVIAYWLGIIAIAYAKGKPGLATLGIIFHLFALIGAIRLAEPSSWWARHFYDEATLQRAKIRYGISDTGPAPELLRHAL